eukprot:PLAT790.2.p1 GENE.PLAT790.2~~PLAT790.2.p1  ORF type:complete len:173 (+),score=29.47 PLAT790.2:51-569(+)
MAAPRLRREISALRRAGDDMVVLLHDDGDMYSWRAFIKGPPDTAFEGGVYELSIKVDFSYPMTPPTMRFATPVFHPNVKFDTGEICVDILKSQWGPTWGLHSACQAIIQLLAHPEHDSPLNCDAGNLLRCGDRMGFDSLVAMYREEYASSLPPGIVFPSPSLARAKSAAAAL